MLTCFTAGPSDARPVVTVTATDYQSWLEEQSDPRRRWLEGSGFKGKAGRVALLPGADGAPEAALLVTARPPEPWDFAALRRALPAGDWRLASVGDAMPDAGVAALGFALADYRFDRYRKVEREEVRLAVSEGDAVVRRARAVAEGVYLARDLINTPASDLGPGELAEAARGLAERHGAAFAEVVGDDLLARDYPAIHAVGRASTRAPRLIDITRGDPDAPKVTLVGKGVCFDTGGLDIKPADAMSLMKKDMGGAAVMLGLAHAIMALDLPVRLRVLAPAVENSVDAASFRPGDVLRTRKGLTVEIGNTDAEGRLVLADALAEADRERPDLLLDAATLTGAARVALGPDLPALFTPDDALAAELLEAGGRAFDPLWRLPLHTPYREMIDSEVADINNAGQGRFAGAITAALFLKEFVSDTPSWAHLDVYAWTPTARPGRPKGGEATALRALFAAIERRYAPPAS